MGPTGLTAKFAPLAEFPNKFPPVGESYQAIFCPIVTADKEEEPPQLSMDGLALTETAVAKPPITTDTLTLEEVPHDAVTSAQ